MQDSEKLDSIKESGGVEIENGDIDSFRRVAIDDQG